MAMKRDYHGILGVTKDADEKEIRKAYRRLALRFHPDRNKGNDAEEKFKEISEAYAVLTGKEKAASPPVMTWEEYVAGVWKDIATRRNDNAYR